VICWIDVQMRNKSSGEENYDKKIVEMHKISFAKYYCGLQYSYDSDTKETITLDNCNNHGRTRQLIQSNDQKRP